MDELWRAFENDPIALVEQIKKLMAQYREEPMWKLHLARAYRQIGDDRAGVFYNRYLDFRKDPEVFGELAQFYEETGKDGLAQIVRKRRDNPTGR
jgi:predicted Zn-dependent protease